MAMRNGKICVFLSIVIVLATLLVFSGSTTAYALNENLIIDEYNGWLDHDVNDIYNAAEDGFDGVLKYIADESNGCFYLYFRLYDPRVADGEDDNIILTFTVENSINRYKFSVNRNGFVNTGQHDIDALNLIYNFEKCSAKGLGGEIFVGFELNNKADREQINYIKCDYASGVENVATLFDNAVLDMYVEPTAEETTAKQSSTAKKKNTTKKTTTQKNAVGEGTTKFRRSGTTAGTNTKFSASHSISENESILSTEIITEQTATEAAAPADLKMSKPAFSIMIAAFVLAGAGAVIIVIALASRKKDEPINDDASEGGDA